MSTALITLILIFVCFSFLFPEILNPILFFHSHFDSFMISLNINLKIRELFLRRTSFSLQGQQTRHLYTIFVWFCLTDEIPIWRSFFTDNSSLTDGIIILVFILECLTDDFINTDLFGVVPDGGKSSASSLHYESIIDGYPLKISSSTFSSKFLFIF